MAIRAGRRGRQGRFLLLLPLREGPRSAWQKFLRAAQIRGPHPIVLRNFISDDA